MHTHTPVYVWLPQRPPLLRAGIRGSPFGAAMPDTRALMTAHGVQHDTLQTSTREQSWAELAYPRDDRGDGGSFYGGGGSMGYGQAPSYELTDAEKEAAKRAKAQVRRRCIADACSRPPFNRSFILGRCTCFGSQTQLWHELSCEQLLACLTPKAALSSSSSAVRAAAAHDFHQGGSSAGAF